MRFTPVSLGVVPTNLLFVILISLLFFTSCRFESFNDRVISTYNTLDGLLQERKLQLFNYLDETKNLARKVQHDKAMTAFFKTKRAYYFLKDSANFPAQIVNEIATLKENIEHYYLMNYLNFYDILFIDTSGEIFYTIRKKSDYHKNIFKGKLSNTELSKKLQELPNESFIDFQFYEISGEPSAFFIEPVIDNGKTIGWFVLQCAVNKINNLFLSNNDLGTTGEIILVNKEHYLLTNSRFNAEPTILKQKLPHENIASKFKEKNGRKSVVDYRGKEVYSVFNVFNFFGSEWLIIAKIDKNEIATKFYLKNKKTAYQKLKKNLNTIKLKNEPYHLSNKLTTYVDMDEFQRADTSTTLITKGVSTCTAVSVSHPGRFSYMAHISPYDVIYNESYTDLLNQVCKQISYFEITQYEKQELEFSVMSTQLNSLENLIGVILENGYFLSQIKFISKPDATYGNLYNNNADSLTLVEWKLNNNKTNYIYQNFKNIPNLEQILLTSQN